MISVNIAGIKKHSLVNGPGIRYVLFMQGCPHDCKGCQNPETHDINGGIITNTDAVVNDILGTKFIDGVTLSGGDPLMQPEAAYDIVSRLKATGLDIWIYTGWTWEQLTALSTNNIIWKILENTNVLVDGRFESNLQSDECLFRGSTNQRLIDVRASLNQLKISLVPCQITIT